MHNLLADIGGTHIRFALSDGTSYSKEEVYRCAEFDTPAKAISKYVDVIPETPQSAAFCIAGPVHDDEVSVTNNHWSFSQRDIMSTFSFDSFYCLNDFEAVAFSIPALRNSEHIRPFDHGNTATKDGYPIVVLGPGTGLGVATLFCKDGKYYPIAGEGPHIDMPVQTDEEFAVLKILQSQYGFTCAEDICSGPGIENVFRALYSLKNNDGNCPAFSAKDISEKALGDECKLCEETLHFMFRILGRVAGNVALITNAFGGVYVAGGIVQRYGNDSNKFMESFRHGFCDKGRYTSYLETIPSFTVHHPFPAFVGLQSYLRSQQST